MAKSAADLITILRNTTGRVDASDPLFTDEIMLQYLNDFLALESTMDIRIFKNYTWYEFDIDPTSLNPYPVDLQGLKLSTIGPPAYISYVIPPSPPPSFVGSFPLFWYQSPAEFYAKWPDFPTVYQPQRPQDVLYYNNELTFRGPPDREYHVKIQAYHNEIEINAGGNLSADYLFRYAAYGAALDIFSDYGEMDKWNEIFPVFRRYRAFVYSRTNSQYQNQRPAPEF